MKNKIKLIIVKCNNCNGLRLYLVLLIMLQLNHVFSQTELSIIEKGKPAIINYKLNERVNLTCDRVIYLVGETVYFSCITYEPILKSNLEISRVVYIEFFSSDNIPIKQLKIEMHHGLGSGYFEIPKQLPSGVYYLRAYTNYMKNEGCGSFYMQSISVFNPFEKRSLEVKANLPVAINNLTVHAEGGNFVYNALNKAICFSSDIAKNPVAVSGRLIDQTNTLITVFNTNELGIGSFSFIPKPMMEYRIELAGLKTFIQYPLKIATQSISISEIDQIGDCISIKLNSYNFTQFPLVMVVVKNNAVVKLLEIEGKTDSIIQIPASLIPNGLVQFQLRYFNEKVVASRNFIIQSTEKSYVKISTNKEVFKSREPIILKLESNKEKRISLSITVIDKKSKSNLNSQLRSMDYEGELYSHLDNVKIPLNKFSSNEMLLNDILIVQDSLFEPTGKPKDKINYNPNYLPELHGDIITGRLHDIENKPIGNAIISQTFIDTISKLNTFKTNSDGKFYFYSNESNTTNELVLSHNAGVNGHISFQQEFYSDFEYITKEIADFSCFDNELWNKMFLNLQINDSYRDVFKKDSIITEISDAFYGLPDRIFKINAFIPLVTLEEFIFEVVPWVFPYNNAGKKGIKIFYKGTDIEIGENPLILLDGIPILDQESLLNMRCKDLRSVSVVYNQYFYQNSYFDGILDIKSNKGDGKLADLPSNCQKYQFNGIQQPIKKSLGLEMATSTLPNFKNQLFWEPAFHLYANTPKSINFLAPDNPGLFMVKCTVLNSDGSKEYFYSSFEVVP